MYNDNRIQRRSSTEPSDDGSERYFAFPMQCMLRNVKHNTKHYTIQENALQHDNQIQCNTKYTTVIQFNTILDDTISSNM